MVKKSKLKRVVNHAFAYLILFDDGKSVYLITGINNHFYSNYI